MENIFHRRRMLKCAGAIIAAPHLWLPSRAEEPAWATQTVGPFVDVEIASGRIRGGHSRGALAFKGIPYAGPVSGKNRFKSPPSVVPWTGVRDATRLGPPAPQGQGTTYGEHEPSQNEDCLVLNVWTPAVKDGGKRPVMFYLHGGGFTTGSGGQNIQDGSHLAATYDVVVVAINHRLGLLGYLYLGELGDYPESGNQGQLDMVAALAWVKQNISVFGGDPNNVMVFGESGGGYKTAMLMGMPSAHGLFHKAGIQSGPGLRGISKAEATETARRVLAAFDLTDPAKLADVPVEKILGLQLAEGKGALATPTKEWAAHHMPKPGVRSMAGGFGPVTDGKILPADPFDPVATPLSANMPLLIGNTREEAIFFFRDNPAFFKSDEAAITALAHQGFGPKADEILALYKKSRPNASPVEIAIAAATAESFGNDTVTLADRKSKQPAPVYRYRYDYASNAPIKGTDWTFRSGHASDISLVFLNQEILDLQGNGPGLNEAARAMSSYFTSFARHAAPKAKDQPDWPHYTTATRPVMLINSKCRLVDDPDSEERKFWQGLG